MVLVCRPCAGEPPPVEAEPDYDEMVVAVEQMEEDIDDSYADVEVSIDAEPPDGDGDSTVSGSVDVDERPPRQRDPTLPPVMIDKGR